MKRDPIFVLSRVRKMVEHVAYISYFVVSALFALMFAALMIVVFIVSQETLVILTDKMFLFLDQFKWYLALFMVGIGVYGIARMIVENILEDTKKRG